MVNRVKRKSSTTKIVISGVVQRHDKTNIESMVKKLNEDLRSFCQENIIEYLSNENVDDSCLGRGQLHPNKKGKAYMAKIFINCIAEYE